MICSWMVGVFFFSILVGMEQYELQQIQITFEFNIPQCNHNIKRKHS